MNKGNGHGTHKRAREPNLSPETAPLSSKKSNNRTTPPKMELAAALASIQTELVSMRGEFKAAIESVNENLTQQLGNWQQEKVLILNKQAELEARIERMERQQIRNNIVITGLNVPTDPRTAVQSLFTDGLGQSFAVSDVFKINAKTGASRIVVKMASAEDKATILKNKNALLTSQPNIFISSDLIQKDRFKAFKARQLKKSILEKDKSATVTRNRDTIIANGITYAWNGDKQEFVKQKNL